MNKMVVFVSSYFNHHQKSLSDALYNAFRNSFYFIQTEEMAIEVLKNKKGPKVYFLLMLGDFLLSPSCLLMFNL